MKGAGVKRLLESIGGAAASARFKGGLAALETEETKLRAERVAAEAEIEDRVGLGEDPAGLAERILAIDQKLRALSFRRGPLTKNRDEADAVEAAKAEKERLARRAVRLQEKRERGRVLRDQAEDGLYSALTALTRLDVVELEALDLSDLMGTGDIGLKFDADPSTIAARAMRRVLAELPAWVADAGHGAVDRYPLTLTVFKRVFEPERFPEG